jgi:hypothetical protein
MEIGVRRAYRYAGSLLLAVVAISGALVCRQESIRPPEGPPPLASTRFPGAQLEIAGRDPGREKITLMRGETFAYAGSVYLAEDAGEGRDESVRSLLHTLVARLLAAYDGGEITMSTSFPKTRRDGNQVLFEGEMESGSVAGEMELRFSMEDPETGEVLPVYRAVVTVKEPATGEPAQ